MIQGSLDGLSEAALDLGDAGEFRIADPRFAQQRPVPLQAQHDRQFPVLARVGRGQACIELGPEFP